MQHDIQEFNRVLCDNLETKMKGTPVDGTIANLFQVCFICLCMALEIRFLVFVCVVLFVCLFVLFCLFCFVFVLFCFVLFCFVLF